MKWLVLFILLISQVSKADFIAHGPYDHFGPFEHEVASFKAVSDVRAKTRLNWEVLRIVMVPTLGPSLIGWCSGPTPLVIISEEYWVRSNYIARQQLIWHELGHCLLGRKHRTVVDKDDKPLSIMYPDASVVTDLKWYQAHLPALTTELFKYQHKSH